MICISVTPESRKLAKVDLLNASRRCDLVELCLDKLIKVPDVGELIAVTDKPILISCRRPEDGGQYEGSESDRRQLLRNAVVAGPAYIELDFDAAEQIPRFGETRRVVSFASLDHPLSRVDDILQRAAALKADVVKFTWPTPTLDDVWPLLVAVNKKQNVPVVGVGLGDSSLTYSLLGLRYGSPWIYAALERGMEAHVGQPTVWELDDVYDWREIRSVTRFVGLLGFRADLTRTAAGLNRVFRQLESPFRCLPIEVGRSDRLCRMLDSLKIRAVLVHPREAARVAGVVDQLDTAARESGHVDLLLKRKDGWHGYNTLAHSAARSVLASLQNALSTRSGQPELAQHTVLILGAGGTGCTVAAALGRLGGPVSLTDADESRGREAAEACGVRFVPFSHLYDTLADVVVRSDPSIALGHRKTELNPSYFRPQMTVLDLAHGTSDSAFLREARERGCTIAESADITCEQYSVQVKSIAGVDVSPELLKSCFEQA